VLPHVEHEQRYRAVPDVPLVVVNLLDHQALAERLPGERAPTRSLYVECGLGELASHAGEGAEELVDRPRELAIGLAAAGWRPADPITLRSSLGIAESVVLDRPDPDAPMSTLLLFGRHQDLAFEKEVGTSARERNHVRFWRTDLTTDGGRPVWVGAATFDRGVGVSHTSGQITHHIGADIDAERDTLMHDLTSAGRLTALYDVTGVGPTVNGRNGGGDRYFTDGELTVGVLAPEGSAGTHSVTALPSPTPVVIKNQLWSWLRPLLGDGEAAPAPGERR